MTQHELVVDVLMGAGGQPPEAFLPPRYAGRKADVIFPDEDIIVEVKSLTMDRAADPKVSGAVGEMFARSTNLGAPVVFGRMQIGLHDLPPKVAANTLRIIGQRVLSEVRAANSQIKATKVALERPHAKGVLALVTPPFKLDRRSVAWLIRDALREGRNSSVNVIFLVETSLAAPPGTHGRRDSFMNFYSRDGDEMPRHLGEAIYQAWGRVTGQVGRLADEEDFRKLGATS
jgi:hypothetical protein